MQLVLICNPRLLMRGDLYPLCADAGSNAFTINSHHRKFPNSAKPYPGCLRSIKNNFPGIPGPTLSRTRNGKIKKLFERSRRRSEFFLSGLFWLLFVTTKSNKENQKPEFNDQ